MRDEMPVEIQSLIAQCEANVNQFTNDQMSSALHFAEAQFAEHHSDYRRETLAKLLEPITWHMSSSVEWRKWHVSERRKQVRLVLPFLNEAESAEARKWLQDEKHEGLWE